MAKTTGALKGSRARSQSFSKAGLAAILSLSFGERELAAMAQRVVSAVDRAEKFRIPGETRVDVELMGFLKMNRGGLGISPAHAHEICEDRMKNGTRLSAGTASTTVCSRTEITVVSYFEGRLPGGNSPRPPCPGPSRRRGPSRPVQAPSGLIN